MRTREFLASQPPDRPFCLIVYFKSPHDPYQPDPRDAALFADVRIPEPATYTDEHFARLPEFIRKSEGRTRALKAHPDRDAWQEFAKQYLRCIASIDRAVGEIVADLAREGMSENTVIAYTSDNGFFLGERGLSHKWLMYEESICVPLIICDPRSPIERRGVEEEALVLNIDVTPTFFDLAGSATPQEVDGVSLAPWLTGRSATWREDFFYEHHFHNGHTIPRTEGVRSASAKYVRYFDEGEKYEEYFDLRSDPHEERNRAADPAAAAERERLRERYQEYLRILPPAVVPP